MGFKSYRGPKNIPRIDGSESLNGWVRKIAEKQTYPAVRRRNKLSLDADPIFLYFYQKLLSGRRCTCWGKDASPHSGCKNCFSTGFVGGYQKFGTTQVLVEPSLPEIVSVGIVRETVAEGPEVWVLDENSSAGYLQARLSFHQGCWGPVDHLSTLQYEPPGTAVRWWVRSLGDTQWVPLNEDNLNRLFTRPQLLEVRAELERSGIEEKSPVVVNAHIRIKRTPEAETIVRADRPKITRSFALAELGLLDEWTTANYWLDDTIAKITSDDWFYNTKEGIRWKAVDATDLAPQEFLLSWDVVARRVQSFEPIENYPI